MTMLTRAESSVGVMYRSSGSNTGSNPGGRQILNKKRLNFLDALYFLTNNDVRKRKQHIQPNYFVCIKTKFLRGDQVTRDYLPQV